MTSSSSPSGESPDALPDWAVAIPAERRPERAGGYLQLAFGLLLVAASLAVVGVEAWQILTQPTISTDETVIERLGWPLVPGIFGAGLLLERWYSRGSIDV